MAKKTESKGKIWLKQNIAEYRPSIALLTVITVLATACSVGFAYLSSFLIDSATDKDNSRLILFSCIVLALLIGRIAFRAISNYYAERCRATIVTDLRGKLFKKVFQK